LGDKYYHGHGGSQSDHNYSAKVSDLEMLDSGSIRSSHRNIALAGWDSSASNSDISAQLSDPGTEVESEVEVASESTYSELESGLEEYSHTTSRPDLETKHDVFLTEGKVDMCGTVDFSQETGLIQATKNGDIPLTKSLIEKGCDLDATDSNRRTALHVASSLGRLEIVRLLVQGGANVDAPSIQGQTLLHEACINGRHTIMQELSSEVVDLDMVDAKGLSAAHYCAMNGEVKCLSLLCNQVGTTK
jgi:hypothetical protein